MALLTWSGRILEEMTIAEVTSAAPQRGSLDKQITATGKLTAGVTIPIILDDSARVTEVYVTAGSLVNAGDTLFMMDYNKLLDSARDSVASAQQTVDWALADMTSIAASQAQSRWNNLQLMKKAVADAGASGDTAAIQAAQNAYDLERGRSNADKTQREFIQKAEALMAARDELARLEALTDANSMRTVTSPADGSITSISVSVGQATSASGVSAMVCDQSAELGLTVQVSEDSAAELAIGDTARITVSGTDYNAAISSIALAADSSDRYDVGFLLPGDVGTVGQSASVRITKRTQSYDVIIPLNALYSDSDGDYVFVIEQSTSSLGARVTVRRVDVYITDQDSGRAALQTGAVSQRDLLVTRSDRSIADGDRVRVGN
ncbi:hypothetical protein FACS1894184_10000 [Clostridia bacterium]|nr:hypothetical protein FACS1894184_10000 [Clostridia bacterium]